MAIGSIRCDGEMLPGVRCWKVAVYGDRKCEEHGGRAKGARRKPKPEGKK